MSQKIDVKQIIKDKSPRASKFIPGFIIRYLKKIIHEDEINYALEHFSHLQGVEFVNKTLELLGFHYEVEGKENIPAAGKFIIASNHPLGGLDGLILMSEASKYFPRIKFIVNDILMNLPNLAPIFVPVNKHGKQSLDYVKVIEETYADDNTQILYFPAGLCSRKVKGNIVDLEWKKSFIEKAIKHKRDIIPVYFEGRNSSFFYNLSNIRKFFGIKANIEMLYLPDEMFRQKNKTIRLKFGKPIPHTLFDNRLKSKEWAEAMKKHVYLLKNDISITFNPFVKESEK